MTLYVVQAKSAALGDLEKARFVEDGFSKPAFVFAQVWLLYHRLWLPLAIWILLEVAYFLSIAPHVDTSATIFVDLLAHLYIGFEGNRLRLRRDVAVQDVVEARDREEAEAVFFHRHLPSTAGA